MQSEIEKKRQESIQKTPTRQFNMHQYGTVTPNSDISLFEIERDYKLLDKEKEIDGLKVKRDGINRNMRIRDEKIKKIKVKLEAYMSNLEYIFYILPLVTTRCSVWMLPNGKTRSLTSNPKPCPLPLFPKKGVPITKIKWTLIFEREASRTLTRTILCLIHALRASR